MPGQASQKRGSYASELLPGWANPLYLELGGVQGVVAVLHQMHPALVEGDRFRQGQVPSLQTLDGALQFTNSLFK